jgi:hypothetical protein
MSFLSRDYRPNGPADLDVHLSVVVRPVDAIRTIEAVAVLSVADDPIVAWVFLPAFADDFLRKCATVLTVNPSIGEKIREGGIYIVVLGDLFEDCVDESEGRRCDARLSASFKTALVDNFGFVKNASIDDFSGSDTKVMDLTVRQVARTGINAGGDCGH